MAHVYRMYKNLLTRARSSFEKSQVCAYLIFVGTRPASNLKFLNDTFSVSQSNCFCYYLFQFSMTHEVIFELDSWYLFQFLLKWWSSVPSFSLKITWSWFFYEIFVSLWKNCHRSATPPDFIFFCSLCKNKFSQTRVSPVDFIFCFTLKNIFDKPATPRGFHFSKWSEKWNSRGARQFYDRFFKVKPKKKRKFAGCSRIYEKFFSNWSKKEIHGGGVSMKN